MSTSWIRNNHTVNRPSSPNPPGGKVSDAPINEYQWINWDFSVDPGTYKLEVVSHDAAFFNYFTAGIVATPLQVEPTNPDNRFGEAYGIVAPYPIMEGIGKSGNPLQPQNLLSLTFRINSVDECLRIESWVQHPDRVNPAPLPPGFSYFPHVWGRPSLRFPTVTSGIARTNSLEKAFPSVSRISFDGDTVLFGAEDGEDADFNDLIVRLSRIGG